MENTNRYYEYEECEDKDNAGEEIMERLRTQRECDMSVERYNIRLCRPLQATNRGATQRQSIINPQPISIDRNNDIKTEVTLHQTKNCVRYSGKR